MPIRLYVWSVAPTSVVEFIMPLNARIDGFTSELTHIVRFTQPVEHTFCNAEYSAVIRVNRSRRWLYEDECR